MNEKNYGYGVDDNSYKAAGELAGITLLVDEFYNNMSVFTEAKKIRDMHPSDLTESRTKLAYFLSGWLGGPRIYAAAFGSLSIPSAHQHLPVGEEESEAWLHCMQKALENQPYEETFKVYLINQLRVPAERIRAVCARNI
ncbi:hemoglobin [Neptunomonas antarctica]|uniref:Hemoglobin n=2 Tax=Neptunomonas antarctica TaxID=619304 RepID=A0A1N7LGR9_9GAMM|nr:group II truncated hemoglobin [Neptunomonas antarctica]SIS72976.1 hemoglobin [Neptunomonas antarctica]